MDGLREKFDAFAVTVDARFVQLESTLKASIDSQTSVAASVDKLASELKASNERTCDAQKQTQQLLNVVTGKRVIDVDVAVMMLKVYGRTLLLATGTIAFLLVGQNYGILSLPYYHQGANTPNAPHP